MASNKLQVTQVGDLARPPRQTESKSSRRQEIQATMERLWLTDPEQFNPMRDAVQRKRLSITAETLREIGTLQGKRAADLGCGGGELTRKIRDMGMTVYALDAATKALQKLSEGGLERITPLQDCLPSTRLDDDGFDLVNCTEVVGYLQPVEYRLFFAELARLVKKDGHVCCSSSIDIDSDNALEKFAALAETEFAIDKWVLSYDLLWIKCCRLFETPYLYFKASRDSELRRKGLQKRHSVSKAWYTLNTTWICGTLWRGVSFIANPLASFLRQSETAMNFLEKITKILWDESGISNALFIGKRRPMTYPLPKDELPRELKHKRQVWE